MPKKPKTHRVYAKPSSERQQQQRMYDEHRQANPGTAMADAIRKSHRWAQVRAIKIKQEPMCRGCRNKRPPLLVVAQDVDHIIPIQERPDLAFRLDNLQSLCRPCHAKKSGEERRRK